MRNFLHDATCFVTGHPVDVATGRLFTELVDLELPGPIPLRFERRYDSNRAGREGVLGFGWSHTYEQKLWFELRRKSLDGFQFVRNAAVCGVVVDFYCARRNLVVEVDEGVDADDVERDALLTKNGLLLLRFQNDQVDDDVSAVVEVIRSALVAQSTQHAA